MIRVFTLLVVAILPCYVSAQSAQETTFSTDKAILTILDEREIPVLVSGKLEHVYIREGSIVQEGQLVAEIESSKAELDVTRLEKELDYAKTEASSTVDLEYSERTISVSKAELERAIKANQRSQGAVPTSELDQLKLVIDKSVAEREKIKFGMELLKKRVEIDQIELNIGKKLVKDHQVHSPVDGMVVEMFKKKGEWAELSKPIAKVVRLDRLKAEIRVPAESTSRELLGKPGVFIPRLNRLKDQEFPLKVIFIQPEVNPVTATVRVWVEIENPELSLMPGLEGTVILPNLNASSADPE